jgi:branched-chain amino acid transport system ATP-binding protein
MSELMTLQGVSKSFGGLMAVSDVSLAIRSQEIFGIIGPNGAGKTTLFNLLTGLTRVGAGSIRFLGQELSGRAPEQIARLGIARTFQNIRLFGGMSVLDNVRVARQVHARSGVTAAVFGTAAARREEREARARSEEMLRLTALSDRARQPAHSLPYGDRRRLEIARALALEPKLLLLDEPAAGMNPGEKQALTELIRMVQQRFALTVLLIEHNVPLVMRLCQRIAVLNFGQLIAVGSPQQVQDDPQVIAAYLGAARA